MGDWNQRQGRNRRLTFSQDRMFCYPLGLGTSQEAQEFSKSCISLPLGNQETSHADVKLGPLPWALGHRKASSRHWDLWAPIGCFLPKSSCVLEPEMSLSSFQSPVFLPQPLSGTLVGLVVVNFIHPEEKALWLTGASALSCSGAGFSPSQENRNPGQIQRLC